MLGHNQAYVQVSDASQQQGKTITKFPKAGYTHHQEAQPNALTHCGLNSQTFSG